MATQRSAVLPSASAAGRLHTAPCHRGRRAIDSEQAVAAATPSSVCTFCTRDGCKPDRSFHAFGAPLGVDHLLNTSCRANRELESHAIVPVTATSTTGVGRWFYYAAGCSDTAWPLGRTVVARNRWHALLVLAQRLLLNRGRRSSFRDAAELAAERIAQHNRTSGWSVGAVTRARHLLQRPNATLQWLLLESAKGIFGRATASDAPGSSCATGLSAYPERCMGDACTLKWKLVLGREGLLDEVSDQLLHEMASHGEVLDTIVLHQQLQGGFRSVHWTTEIWDVRHVAAKAVAVDAGTSPPRAAGPLHLNGTACVPSPCATCLACVGSALEVACNFRARQGYCDTDTWKDARRKQRRGVSPAICGSVNATGPAVNAMSGGMVCLPYW